jgi:hypothetical protein
MIAHENREADEARKLKLLRAAKDSGKSVLQRKQISLRQEIAATSSQRFLPHHLAIAHGHKTRVDQRKMMALQRTLSTREVGGQDKAAGGIDGVGVQTLNAEVAETFIAKSAKLFGLFGGSRKHSQPSQPSSARYHHLGAAMEAGAASAVEEEEKIDIADDEGGISLNDRGQLPKRNVYRNIAQDEDAAEYAEGVDADAGEAGAMGEPEGGVPDSDDEEDDDAAEAVHAEVEEEEEEEEASEDQQNFMPFWKRKDIC